MSKDRLTRWAHLLVAIQRGHSRSRVLSAFGETVLRTASLTRDVYKGPFRSITVVRSVMSTNDSRGCKQYERYQILVRAYKQGKHDIR